MLTTTPSPAPCRGGRALVLTLLVCAVAPGAAAQDAESHAPREAEARALFEAGEAAHNEGHYAEAEEYFRRSYELSGHHLLLWNIALAAELARHDEAALAAYEAFVEHLPNNERVGRARTRIAALREMLDGGGDGDDAAPPPRTTDPATTTSRSSSGGGGDATVPWILFGASAAVAITGGVLLGVAAADVSAVENPGENPRWADVADAYDRSEPLSIAGAVLLGVGGAAMVGTLVWAILAGGDDDEPTAQLLVGPGTLGVRGAFQ